MKNKDSFNRFFKTNIPPFGIQGVLLLLSITLFSSCAKQFSLQKRLYSKGYYFSAKENPKKTERQVVVKKNKDQTKLKSDLPPKPAITALVESHVVNQDYNISSDLKPDFATNNDVSVLTTFKSLNANGSIKRLNNSKVLKLSKMLHKKDPMQGLLIGFGGTLGLTLSYYLITLLLVTFTPYAVVSMALGVILIIISIVALTQISKCTLFTN